MRASASNIPAILWTFPSLSSIERHMLISPPHSPMTVFPFSASVFRPSRKSVFSDIAEA